VAEEEDWRRRHGRGDSVEDGAVDIRWPLSPSCARGRAACCSVGFLSIDIKRDPQSARNR
jgi:hypothetical protein